MKMILGGVSIAERFFCMNKKLIIWLKFMATKAP